MIVLRNGGYCMEPVVMKSNRFRFLPKVCQTMMTEHEFAQRSKLQNLLFHQRSQNLWFFKKTHENT